MNGVQTRLKCKPNVKRCKRFVFPSHSPLLHHNALTAKAISHFQADHILTRFVFPPLQLKHSNRPISLNSASGYYSTFRGLLKIAYRDKWFRENINDYLDKIEPQDVKKEYLTLNEVKQLAATPCDIPVLKAASLFACLTGLRISDILNLQWEDFTIAPDQGYCLRIRTQKTQTEATLPISYEAYELCGTPGTGKVFKDLKRSMINYPLKSWLKKTGITKPITFHGFRHSYAVIQISLGTDIYTVSKMLTHKNVSTTQIYADLVNSKKRETANKISLK